MTESINITDQYIQYSFLSHNEEKVQIYNKVNIQCVAKTQVCAEKLQVHVLWGKILKLKFIHTKWDSIVHVDHTPHFQAPPMCKQTIKRKGEPGKIYHMRNVTGRDNLYNYMCIMWPNKLAQALLTECTHSVVKALWLTEHD